MGSPGDEQGGPLAHRAAGQPGAGTRTAPGRNRYVDLLRVLAIVVVVVGHWLDTTLVTVRGLPAGESALVVVGYVRWLTLLLQVMPLFFLAGGYAAAASWQSWTRRGGRWPGWVHGRLVRLLRPTAWFVAIMVAVLAGAGQLGTDPSVLDQAGWGVALQLWFLPAFMPLVLLAGWLVGAWRRAGWWVLAAAVVATAGVDLLVHAAGVAAAGLVSFLVVPAAGFYLGIAWRAGALRPPVLVAMLAAGSGALVVLVTVFDYPPWMIGVPGERLSNTGPPNLALVAYSAAQIGAVLLLERPLRRWLSRPRVWLAVVRGNGVVLTLFLWHMVPVVLLAALGYGVGLPDGPAAGTAGWWALRPVWIVACAAGLTGLVAIVGRFERPGTPRWGLSGPLPAALLVACVALTGYALSQLALGGLAPDGDLPTIPLLSFGAGLAALLVAGRVAGPR